MLVLSTGIYQNTPEYTRIHRITQKSHLSDGGDLLVFCVRADGVCRSQEREVLVPDRERVVVHADLIQREIVRLGHLLPVVRTENTSTFRSVEQRDHQDQMVCCYGTSVPTDDCGSHAHGEKGKWEEEGRRGAWTGKQAEPR